MIDPTLFVILALVALLLTFTFVHRAGKLARAREAIPRTCAHCKHFDLEEGQAVMGKFPIFRQAAQWIPPSEMGRRVVEERERNCRACEGRGEVHLPQDRDLPVDERRLQDCLRCDGSGKQVDELFSDPSAPATSAWENFGACMLDEVVVDGADTASLRAKRRKDLTDCFELRDDV